VLRSSVQRPGEALAGGSAQHGAQPAQVLPVGLHVRVMHTALRHVVAETTTTESDLAVRCLLHVPDAFYVGEQYTATVESNFGVGGAMATFDVIDGMQAPVELVCSRRVSDVTARLFPLLPRPNHWSRVLSLPPQQLEVLHNSRLIASQSLAWARNATDLHLPISKSIARDGYTIVMADIFSVPIQVAKGRLDASALRLSQAHADHHLRRVRQPPAALGLEVGAVRLDDVLAQQVHRAERLELMPREAELAAREARPSSSYLTSRVPTGLAGRRTQRTSRVARASAPSVYACSRPLRTHQMPSAPFFTPTEHVCESRRVPNQRRHPLSGSRRAP
jgi:hypothetical protein